jgi:hypothetical protein
MLFPNEDERDALVRAGKARTIPGTEDYWIKADGVSQAPEYLHVFAATNHWEPPAGHRGPDDHYTTYQTPQQQQQLQLTLRSLTLESRPKGTPGAVAEVLLPFQVKATK